MKNKIIAISFLCALLCSFSLKAQQGKDGAANITTTTTVNIYTSLTTNALVGAITINVASTTSFSVGDLIYIIQMQGATLRDSAYEWGNPHDAIPRDTGYGKINAYNGAGNNDFAEITSISGNVITLDCALKDSFGVDGKTQVIRVPRYTILTLSGAGKITCPAWNGTTGGVVAIEVQGNTSIGAGTSINVDGMGFRGGAVLNLTNFGATNTGYDYSTHNGARKGESIVGDTIAYDILHLDGNSYYHTPFATCKGNIANGGGGGNAMNCGGGGGSNGGVISNWNGMGNADVSTANNIASWNQESTTPVNGSFRPVPFTSSGGGRGGYSYSSMNSDPTVDGPNSNANWGSDTRHNDGGWGGIPLDYTTGKVFLGGGGGSGDENNNSGTAGGNGGGIVYLLSYGTVTGGGQILADGATALNTNTGGGATHGDDGAGGGGGGGAVFINSTGNITLTNTLSISTQGGVGGSMVALLGITANDNFGPGGGGGGGYVATTNTVTGVNINGGANGIVVQNAFNNTKIATKFPPNGATSGGTGSITTFTPNFYLTATNYTTCASSSLSLSVTVNGTTPSGLSVLWYTVAAGGSSVFTGNPYPLTDPSTAGTYTYYAGTCPGMYRIPIIVTVTSASGPTLLVSATKTITCSGSSDTLTVSGATSYTWSANAGSVITNTALVNPISSTIYTVTGTTTGACAGTSTTSISITVNTPPTITITPTSNTLCTGTSATITASGANTYTWTPNTGLSSTTTSVVVSNPTVTTTYSVTGTTTVGCVGTNTVTIAINPTPTITVNSLSSCGGGTDTLKATGVSTYTWSANAGSATTSSVIVTPTVTTTYTITGTSVAGCSVSATSTVTVTSNPIVTVTSGTICSGGTTTLTASGANTYTWSPATGLSAISGSTVTATPSVTTIYTVTGSVGTCSASPGTTTVTVNPTPTVTVNNPTTICSGTSATLTANGATTYSWTPLTGLSSTTATTVVASPTATIKYTVTGTSSGCIGADTSHVTVNPTPTITVNSATVCVGNSATLTASGATTYSWTPATGLSFTTNSVVVANPTVTTTYSITGTTGGCSSTTIATVSVTPIVTISVTPSANPICSGGSSTLTATGASTYSWNPSGSLSSASGNTVTATPSVTTTYTVTGNVGACSSSFQTVSIIVDNPPTITITPSATLICNGQSTTVTAAGASSYTWSPSAFLSSSTGTTVIASPVIITTFTATGSNGSCTATQTIVIQVVPTVSFGLTTGSPDTVCLGTSVTFSVTGVSSNTYTWSANAGGGNNTVVTVTPSSFTNYSVTGSNGVCTATSAYPINVYSVQSISVTPSQTTICSGSSTTLTATGATTYTWSPATGLSSTSNGVVLANPTLTTTYIVSGSVSTCSAIPTTATVVVGSPPIFTIASTPTVCPSTTTTLTATGNAASYVWSANAGGVTSNSVVVTPLITTTYTVTGNLNNCALPKTTTVNVYTISPLFITPSATTICIDSSITLSTTSGLQVYTWYPSSSSTGSTNIVHPSATMVYSVTGQDAFGCHYDTAIAIVNVITCATYSIIIPNVFSPNGDNINDIFDVTATGINSLTCDIYDRWGLKLYSYNSVTGYWDGTYKGAKEPDGTYFYVILTTDAKGDNHKYNGFLTLIR
jgi:gliding motility-associated-like protein